MISLGGEETEGRGVWIQHTRGPTTGIDALVHECGGI